MELFFVGMEAVYNARMDSEKCAVYILTNAGRNVLYIGATRNLAARIEGHKSGRIGGFAAKYNCRDIVYAEFWEDWNSAIRRERQLKDWKRAWKIALVSESNPNWRDLSGDL